MKDVITEGDLLRCIDNDNSELELELELELEYGAEYEVVRVTHGGLFVELRGVKHPVAANRFEIVTEVSENV